jgi:hypothetical protein
LFGVTAFVSMGGVGFLAAGDVFFTVFLGVVFFTGFLVVGMVEKENIKVLFSVYYKIMYFQLISSYKVIS